ncbi:hypothetical protein NHX12_031651 [Muraenolepis orangiensis]|uniref:Uncharacterized protein n=1 Tax=Muraenolepis orangiensis TaxID=630683 RepID=A0A9Q0IJW1_9TELE|nr:hypothetical protein NHX12_031651 [Muraenolepis orangiensis]
MRGVWFTWASQDPTPPGCMSTARCSPLPTGDSASHWRLSLLSGDSASTLETQPPLWRLSLFSGDSASSLETQPPTGDSASSLETQPPLWGLSLPLETQPPLWRLSLPLETQPPLWRLSLPLETQPPFWRLSLPLETQPPTGDSASSLETQPPLWRLSLLSGPLGLPPPPLKRSFDIDDVDDIPSFSPASPAASPTSPTSSSSHLLLSNNKTNEGRGVGATQQSSSATFNNNNNAPYHSLHSRFAQGSGPGPGLKSRSVTGSLSFNHGNMNKPAFKNNGHGVGGVTRAASFQNRFNPNGYYSSMLSGPGSDNDSLHSSSSSLEYSGGGAPPATVAKYGNTYTGPPPAGEYQHHHLAPPQSPIQGGGGRSLGGNQSLKKVSLHGSVFHSEHQEAPGVVLGCVPELKGVGHGSMPSLDLQFGDRGGGGGGGREVVEREGGGTPLGLRYGNTDANRNGRSHHSGGAGIEVYSHLYSCSNDPNRSPHPRTLVMQSPQPTRAKEPPRLNKFPLDLENLTLNNESEAVVLSPPKPPPRSTGSTPQYPTSPSASLSSLESNPDTSPLGLHHPLSLFPQPSSPSPSSTRGSMPVPGVSRSPVPLSPAQTPQLQMLSGPQAVHLAGGGTGARAALRLPEETQDRPRDSVGSILQRIASFSRTHASDSSGGRSSQSPASQGLQGRRAAGRGLVARPPAQRGLG